MVVAAAVESRWGAAAPPAVWPPPLAYTAALVPFSKKAWLESHILLPLALGRAPISSSPPDTWSLWV